MLNPSSGGVEIFQRLKQVQDNAWMLFNELPPCVARIRALHVFLDAKEVKSQLEKLRDSAPST